MFAEEGVLVGMSDIEFIEEEEEEVAGVDFRLEDKASIFELGGGDLRCKDF